MSSPGCDSEPPGPADCACYPEFSEGLSASIWKENTCNMAVKVGINGFGRIGRNVVRAALNNPEIEFVAVNDLTDTTTLAHMTKYDSLLGPLPEKVSVEGDSIVIGSRKIKVFAEKDPALIDWSSVGAQIVIESTGRFVDKANASKHLR